MATHFHSARYRKKMSKVLSRDVKPGGNDVSIQSEVIGPGHGYNAVVTFIERQGTSEVDCHTHGGCQIV